MHQQPFVIKVKLLIKLILLLRRVIVVKAEPSGIL